MYHVARLKSSVLELIYFRVSLLKLMLLALSSVNQKRVNYNIGLSYKSQEKLPYTTPSTVKEVSAILVATMNRLQFGGGGLKMRTCRINKSSI